MLFDNHDQGNHLDQFFSASVLSLKFLILPLDFFLGGGVGDFTFPSLFSALGFSIQQTIEEHSNFQRFPKVFKIS